MKDISNTSILVTPKTFGLADYNLKLALEKQAGTATYNTFGRTMTLDELAHTLPQVDGIILGSEIMNGALIRQAARLKVISRYGVGLENIDLQAATDHGVIVTHTPGANTNSVAELTVGLIICLLRKICDMNALTKIGKWGYHQSSSLEYKTIGVIGYGAVGQAVVRRLLPFGCTIMVNVANTSPAMHAQNQIQFYPLDDVLVNADLITLHIPLNDHTKNLINEPFLSKMKPGAYIVNTARGALVNEAALIAALNNKHLGGYATDVLAEEPPRPDHPLLHMAQVIVTPHNGAHTDSAINEMGRRSLQNCLDALRGIIPADIVNPQVLGRAVTK